MKDYKETREAYSFEDVLDAGIGGTAVYELRGDQLKTVYFSDGLPKLTGYSCEEYEQLLDGNTLDLVIEEDRARILVMIREALKGDGKINTIFQVRHKTEQHAWVHTSSIAEQLEDCIRIRAVFLKSVEREKDRYRDIFNILGIACWEWSAADGIYTSEKYGEYAIGAEDSEAVWEDNQYAAFIHPDDIALYDAFMKENITDKQRKSAVIRTKMIDGSYRWSEMYTFAEHAADGTPNRIVSVIRDVDKEWMEQKEKLEEALAEAKRANQAKTDFLSRVSHDMRTPLNGILGLTTLLRESVTDQGAERDLQQLEMSGKYLLNLINDTLDVSKIESGKLELHPVTCDAHTAFMNVLALIQPNVQEKKLHFVVKADRMPQDMIYMDIGRVEQIAMNLLGNAVKFTPEGGTIEITAVNRSVEQGVMLEEVTIRDDGIGMSEAFLPHLFEPFTQESQGRTSTATGTGLGMTITRQLIKLMGGSIHVESELGKGTVFHVLLPVPIATEKQIQEWKANQVENQRNTILDGCRVLLCEDHVLNANIARRLLAARGIVSDLAENGKIGVEMFERTRPGYYDAILMDIRMPVMDGLDAARAIRSLASKREDAKRIPIIAMTANAFDEDVQQVMDAGMNEHLGKPIETEKLFETLERLIALSGHENKEL